MLEAVARLAGQKAGKVVAVARLADRLVVSLSLLAQIVVADLVLLESRRRVPQFFVTELLKQS